jgi:hypothetical protein
MGLAELTVEAGATGIQGNKGDTGLVDLMVQNGLMV